MTAATVASLRARCGFGRAESAMVRKKNAVSMAVAIKMPGQRDRVPEGLRALRRLTLLALPQADSWPAGGGKQTLQARASRRSSGG